MEQEVTAIEGTPPGVAREQRPAEEPDLTWRVLGTLNVFRLLVAVMLLGLFFASGDPRFVPVPSLSFAGPAISSKNLANLQQDRSN